MEKSSAKFPSWRISEKPVKLTHGRTRSTCQGTQYQITMVRTGFPCASAGKESACIVGYLGLIPGLGRSPGEGRGLPIPEFWPGEFHGQRSLAGYNPRDCKELDKTEWLTLTLNTIWFKSVTANEHCFFIKRVLRNGFLCWFCQCKHCFLLLTGNIWTVFHPV